VSKDAKELWECDNDECHHVSDAWFPKCPVCHHSQMYPRVSDKKIVKLHKNPKRAYPKELENE